MTTIIIYTNNNIIMMCTAAIITKPFHYKLPLWMEMHSLYHLLYVTLLGKEEGIITFAQSFKLDVQ